VKRGRRGRDEEGTRTGEPSAAREARCGRAFERRGLGVPWGSSLATISRSTEEGGGAGEGDARTDLLPVLALVLGHRAAENVILGEEGVGWVRR
jgi:hypothetical protein